MKKWLKILLIILGVLVLSIVIDIVSIYTINKPIFAIKEDCDCTDQVYKGLFYDTYNCFIYPAPQVKAKWEKYQCPIYDTSDIETSTDKRLVKTNINNEYNVYYYKLKSVKISVKNKEYEFVDAIKNNVITIDDIVAKLKIVDALYDGGTKVYKNTNKEMFNEEISLVKCHTLDGNNDIYIGNKDMEYRNNFCMDNNQTFIRTYTIKSIEDYKEQQYENNIPVTYSKSLKVTLSEYEGETKTVILNNVWDTLEIDKTYEFEFMLHQNLENKVEDTIESIIKNSSIVEITETSKTGLDQIKDLIK